MDLGLIARGVFIGRVGRTTNDGEEGSERREGSQLGHDRAPRLPTTTSHAFTYQRAQTKAFSDGVWKEIDALENLDAYANALSFAHTAFLAASQPTPPLNALFDRATKLRDTLVSDATALSRRGFLDGKVLESLKGGPGYLNIAYDLGALVRLVRENWPVISQRSCIQASELDDAEALYEQISTAFAERERQSEAATSSGVDRQRAYTLFVNAYDQLRRAATFIRWEQNDADKYVPSLYAGRGGRGNASKNTPVPPPAATATATATTQTTNGAHAPVAVAIEAHNPNMPGGSPFTA